MIRGWCPTLYEPMATGDGLLVRVKPPGGRLSSASARVLARRAARFGNGIVELTGRGNLQIRGLDAAGAPRFAASMVAAGLASADAGFERRRNVMALPLGGDDPTAAGDADALAAALAAMLEAEPTLAALPPKFDFAVDGGGVLALPDAADIAVETDGERHWIRLGGWRAGCAPDATVGLARDLARAAGGRRMRDCDARAMFAAVGLAAIEPSAPAPAAAPVGFTAYPGTRRGAFGVGLPFGQTDAATLEALADLADRFGDGALRVSPWRAVLLGGVRARDAAALRDAAAAGLIADPADRRLSMAACIGSAGCASGTVRAREDAAALANAGWTGFLHVSGCAKGCAHPGVAPVALVGDGGRYRLVRDGHADVAGLSVQQAAACLGHQCLA